MHTLGNLQSPVPLVAKEFLTDKLLTDKDWGLRMKGGLKLFAELFNNLTEGIHMLRKRRGSLVNPSWWPHHMQTV